MDFKGHGTHVAGIIAGKNKWQASISFSPLEADLATC